MKLEKHIGENSIMYELVRTQTELDKTVTYSVIGYVIGSGMPHRDYDKVFAKFMEENPDYVIPKDEEE